MLILMHGASVSGKSWLSGHLMPALQAVRVRSDLERKRLAGIDLRTRLLPDQLTLPLLWLGLIASVENLYVGRDMRILAHTLAAVVRGNGAF